MPRSHHRPAWLVLTPFLLLLTLGGTATTQAGDDPPDPPEPVHYAAFMPDANMVVNVLNGDGSEAIAYYIIEGRKFVGRSCETNGLAISTETVTVPDDVAGKYPELFR